MDRLPDAHAAWWLPAGMTRSQPKRSARFTPAALRPPAASHVKKLVLTARLLESAEDMSVLANGLAQQAAELADADNVTSPTENKVASLAEAMPANVPLPVARPRKLAEAVPVPAEAPSESPFGEVMADTSKPADEAVPDNVPLPAARPKGPIRNLLAYLRPDDSAESTRASVGRVALPGPGSGVAVYDIKAATVYLPNGQRLEAHSGLGHMHDKPKYADEKNRGPTPPNVYNLVMRERPFHGVEAIRLLPVDGVNKYNRVGLLAHTYMLHGTNQSNGCVVFKNYSRFLKAFKKGKIDRLVVVPELSALPRLMASL